jgi:hypothetical protein
MSARTAPVATRPHYVYGVMRAADAPAKAPGGVGGAEVGMVVHDDLAALTSPLESIDVRARRRDLLAHSEVLTSALEQGTVLPAQFGLAFADADAVVTDLLAPRGKELEALLRELDGKVELSVKAFYLEQAILGEIVRENRRVARLRDATRSGHEAATYGARIELGELVAAELRERGRRDAIGILERLQPLASAVELAREPVNEHEVLRASFLVERKRVPEFDEAMNEAARREDGRIRFKYVGPLPPHSFVSLPWAS